MAQDNTIKRYLDAGVAFTAMTQAKAEALVKDLVKAGEVQTEQAQVVVADLIERSRKSTEEFLGLVRKEVLDTIDSLGVATLSDLTRLEKLLESVKPGGNASTPAKKAPAKKAPAKKAPAKKTAAKKTAS